MKMIRLFRLRVRMDAEMDSGYIIFVSWCLFFFFCGSVSGSFVNCIGQRILKNEDWISSGSRCDHCGHELGASDLIPVFSFMMLKGKCRYCHGKLDVRYFISEVLTGMLFLSVFCFHPRIDVVLVRDLILTGMLVGLSLTDLESCRIPDVFILSGIVTWFVSLCFVSSPLEELCHGFCSALLVSGMIFLISFLMKKAMKKDVLGNGDVKWLFMVCLYAGLYRGLWILLLSCLTGLVWILFSGRKMIPFGPCIAAATVLILLGSSGL